MSTTVGAESLQEADPAVWKAFVAEQRRQAETLELIASENHVSRAVREAVGSIFTNKYAEGYPGRRYYGGCGNMDSVEVLARNRARELFKCDHVNVQPHSGSQANTAVYLAALEPGDTILSLDLAHGGHLTHGMRINISGLLYKIVHYTVDPTSEQVDMAAVAALAREHRPKMIVTGASAYPRTIDFAAFAEIAADVGAVQMADIAHIAGMVAVGLHPSPVPVAEFVTTTTHKTLRGPRGGMILCREAFARKIDSRIFPGTQGGPLMHAIVGKAVAFGEALRPEFADYQRQILENARVLADGLKSAGYRLVSGGTDNHLMLVDVRSINENLTGAAAEQALEKAGIITNKNLIPFDPRKPVETSGLRLGTPALTTRGMRADEMETVAGLIDRVLRNVDAADEIARVHEQVRDLCAAFPLPE